MNTKTILKPFTFEDNMREYDRDQLLSIVDDGASTVEPMHTDTNDIYEEFEGELWAILGKSGEEQDKPTLQVLLDYDFAQNINDGDNLRQYLVWYCMELVAKTILEEPEEEEEAE